MGAEGGALTRSNNVNMGTVVREVGEGVVDIRSSHGDGTRGASGGEEFSILSPISGLNGCQGSMHRLLVDVTTNQQRRWERRKQPTVRCVSGRLCE